MRKPIIGGRLPSRGRAELVVTGARFEAVAMNHEPRAARGPTDGDLTGEPPSDTDIHAARSVVARSIVKYIHEIPPELAVQLPNIHRCLTYLQRIKP